MDVKKQIIFQIYKNYRALFDFLDCLKGKKNKQASVNAAPFLFPGAQQLNTYGPAPSSCTVTP